MDERFTTIMLDHGDFEFEVNVTYGYQVGCGAILHPHDAAAPAEPAEIELVELEAVKPIYNDNIVDRQNLEHQFNDFSTKLKNSEFNDEIEGEIWSQMENGE